MTLVLSALSPAYVVQASDRRMTVDSLPKGDEFNKALVLQCDDGIFAVSFTGLGEVGGRRVDMWLAERLLDEGVPELAADDAMGAIALLATEWFRTFPARIDKRHVFAIAGWQKRGAASRPSAWIVSNCLAEDGRAMLGAASDAFEVRRQAIRESGTVEAYGLHQAISRPDRRRLKAALRSARDVDRVEDALVETIRSAASKPAWSWGIGRNCMVISLSPAGEVRATYCPDSTPKVEYGPFFLWYQGGRNYCAADIEALPPPGFGYRFGQAMLVGPSRPGASPPALSQEDPSVARFRFRVSESKHKHDPKRDVTLVETCRVEQRTVPSRYNSTER